MEERMTGRDVQSLRAKVAELQGLGGGRIATTAKNLFTGLLLQIYTDKRLDKRLAKPEDIADDYLLSWNATYLFKTLSNFINFERKPG